MTARDRLIRLQRTLVIALATRAVLVGAAAAFVVLTIAKVFGLSAWTVLLSIIIGSSVAIGMLLRSRGVRSLSRVALWVEERTPSLRYSLVTVADGAQSPSVDAQALSAPWWTNAQNILLKALLAPGIAAILALALAWWAPLANRGASESGAASAAAKAAKVGDVLAVVHVAVTPPSYSGRPATTVDDPTSIETLVGSVITVSGDGDANLLSATADSTPRSVAQRGAGWSITLAMPARPGVVRLHSAAGRDRLIVLAPITDAAPAVTLLIPKHDTIVRRATGMFPLHAQLRDDIGLRDASFELVVSSGSGENFTFRTTTIARTSLGGRTETTLDARVSLDSLKLQPGDILQLRAVARDANNIDGPGIGSSETRSLRVARADEYDSVSVDALPPPEEQGSVLSQRMLLNLTEALVKRQRSLARPMLVSESQRIAGDQRKLRKRVGDIVFQRMGGEPLSEEGTDEPERGKLTAEQVLRMADSVTGAGAGGVMDVEGDETPILAINKPLLEAFNAMWDAGRALEVGEPAKALAPMRIALAAIERARQAERIYLRGKPSTAIVDVAKARLAGKDKGVASIREPRPVVDPVVRRRSATFERVTSLIARDPDAAADSLLLMRVDALGDAPQLAAALDDAARALRKHDNAAIPLAWMRVRRALGGAAEQRAGITPWLGAP
ncbi:MAG: hypothetical protein JWL61_1101 [Gemmatimonadetes bacterium]|nr:hypothetical protein [Gemmatimonadota bacterium]